MERGSRGKRLKNGTPAQKTLINFQKKERAKALTGRGGNTLYSRGNTTLRAFYVDTFVLGGIVPNKAINDSKHHK